MGKKRRSALIIPEKFGQLSEFESKLMRLLFPLWGEDWFQDFLSHLRQIMPPTCTANERKFLDRVSDMEISKTYRRPEEIKLFLKSSNPSRLSYLYGSQFPDVDILKLVRNKKIN